MAFQVSPGINITENDLTSNIQFQTSTQGATAGLFEWGPVNKPIRVISEGTLKDNFGLPTIKNNRYWYSAENFLSYSANLLICRAGSPKYLKNSYNREKQTYVNEDDKYNKDVDVYVEDGSPDGIHLDKEIKIISRYPSKVADTLQISFCDNSTYDDWEFKDLVQGRPSTSKNGKMAGVANDEIHVVIFDRFGRFGTVNGVLEVYQYASKSRNGKNDDGINNYYVDLINNNSKYITIVNQLDEVIEKDGFKTFGLTFEEVKELYNFGDDARFNDIARIGIVEDPNYVNPNSPAHRNYYDGQFPVEDKEYGLTCVYRDSKDGKEETVKIPYNLDYNVVETLVKDKQYTVILTKLESIDGKDLIEVTHWDELPKEVLEEKLGRKISEDMLFGIDFSKTSSLEKVPTFLPKFVNTTYRMFKNGMKLNQSLNSWDMVNVKILDEMFMNNLTFNGDISGWGAEHFRSIKDFLHGALTANPDLSEWKLTNELIDFEDFDKETPAWLEVRKPKIPQLEARNRNIGFTAFDEDEFPNEKPIKGGVTFTLVGGESYDYEDLDDIEGNLMRAFDVYSDTARYDVSLIFAGPVNAVVSNHVLSIATKRKDAVGFISPIKEGKGITPATNKEDVESFRSKVSSTSYGFMDTGYKKYKDRYNNTFTWIPLNSDMAGINARTDRDADPWFSPAGYQRGIVNNVVELSYNPNDADRDDLYKIGVNSVISMVGSNTILYGDKTLYARPSAFGYINVRRLLIIIEKTIAVAARNELFEFNDVYTRNAFINQVVPFLRQVKGRRGITDFLVVCDESNNTPDIIDNKQFVGDIYIKPAMSINYIQLNANVVNTSASFEEIIGMGNF